MSHTQSTPAIDGAAPQKQQGNDLWQRLVRFQNRMPFFKYLGLALLLAGFLLATWFLIYGHYFDGDFTKPDAEKAKSIQPFLTGLVAPLLTLGTTLLVFENLRNTTRQNFSNNFFKLIDQHQKLVDNINTTVEGVAALPAPVKGREFFDYLAEAICNKFNATVEGQQCDTSSAPPAADEEPTWETFVTEWEAEQKKESDGNVAAEDELDLTGLEGKERLLKLYDHYFHVHQSDLSHYFRNLYHIVRYADRAPFSQSFRTDHIKFLRAQLSNYELLLLAYNGLHDYGGKFKPLIEKYELLKVLNTEERLSPSRLKRIVDVEILRESYPHFKKHNPKR